jgi:hypothetical protein
MRLLWSVWEVDMMMCTFWRRIFGENWPTTVASPLKKIPLLWSSFSRIWIRKFKDFVRTSVKYSQSKNWKRSSRERGSATTNFSKVPIRANFQIIISVTSIWKSITHYVKWCIPCKAIGIFSSFRGNKLATCCL